MSDKLFVDTNILVYAHDRGSGEKHDRASALVGRLWLDRTGAISTQVLQELYVNIRRKAANPISLTESREVIGDYLTWQVVVNDGSSILRALDVEARYAISFWDALIVQAAQQCGAKVLYSEDLSSSQKYGPVEVINPLTV